MAPHYTWWLASSLRCAARMHFHASPKEIGLHTCNSNGGFGFLCVCASAACVLDVVCPGGSHSLALDDAGPDLLRMHGGDLEDGRLDRLLQRLDSGVSEKYPGAARAVSDL